jgi:hypothetical protein
MGNAYLWECDICEHQVETSGPWEFYRDKLGRRKKYRPPFVDGDEVVEAGVSGLSAEMYCFTCDKITDRIIIEYKVPIKDSLNVKPDTPEPREKYLKTDAIKCRTCSNTTLLLENDKALL